MNDTSNHTPTRKLTNAVGDEILGSLHTVVIQQQNLLERQQRQMDSMQEQLGMLTEVATKLAIMEERRIEDKTRVADMEKRMEVVRDMVVAKFPQYDSLLETYKTLNNKLWGALAAAIVAVIIAASKQNIFG